jgi:hypothetical protein
VRDYFGGVVARTLHRWKNDARLGFPRPATINGRDYYDPQEIEDFALRLRAIADHEAKKAAESKPAEVQANNKPAAAAKRAAKSAADKTDAEAQAEDSKSKTKPTVKPAGRPRGRPRHAAASTNEMVNT